MYCPDEDGGDGRAQMLDISEGSLTVEQVEGIVGINSRRIASVASSLWMAASIPAT